MPNLADALFPRTKQRVLGLLFGQPDRAYGTTELIELAHSGRGAVQRELELLNRVGLIETEVVGLQKRYRANRQAPIFGELRAIVEKTGGIAGVVRAALEPIAKDIEIAILYGSTAKNTVKADSDVDVLLVANDLTMEAAYRAFEPAEAQLGRRVSPTIYDRSEFDKRRNTKQSFVAKVLAGPHQVLLGALDGNRAAG